VTVVAIASYRPREGQEEPFLQLLQQQIAVLRAEGLITGKPEYRMLAQDGAIIEVFEWVSFEAKQRARETDAVMLGWDRYFELADVVPLAALEEAGKPFAAFETI